MMRTWSRQISVTDTREKWACAISEKGSSTRRPAGRQRRGQLRDGGACRRRGARRHRQAGLPRQHQVRRLEAAPFASARITRQARVLRRPPALEVPTCSSSRVIALHAYVPGDEQSPSSSQRLSAVHVHCMCIACALHGGRSHTGPSANWAGAQAGCRGGGAGAAGARDEGTAGVGRQPCRCHRRCPRSWHPGERPPSGASHRAFKSENNREYIWDV